MTRTTPLDRAKGHEVMWTRVEGIFKASARVVSPTFVYVIGEHDGAIKIGYAKNPIQRLRSMQTGNPRRLRVEHVLFGDKRVERLLHDLWESHAIRARPGLPGTAPGTEWFNGDTRDELDPILTTAAERQIAYLEAGEPSMDSMEQAVREAHVEHDFVASGRDHVHLLGNVAGYVTSRPSLV